jgi:hypothetical protein
MPLSGSDWKRLQDAILAAFTTEDLVALLNTDMEIRLPDFVNTNAPGKQVVAKVREYLEQRGLERDFLIAARDARPRKSNFQQVLNELIGMLTTAEPKTEPALDNTPGAPDNPIGSQAAPLQGPTDRAPGKATTAFDLPHTLGFLRDCWESERNRHRRRHPAGPDPDFSLNSFCGNDDSAVVAEITPRSKLLSTPAFAIESVYYLWADPRSGGTISARLVRQGKLRHVVRFNNESAEHTGNVAFRPTGRTVLRSPDGAFNRLAFRVRISASSAGSKARDRGSAGKADEAVLAVRVVDRYQSHWKHADHGYNLWKQIPCSDPEQWQEVRINLACPEWELFRFDGNWKYPPVRPDFSEIMAVVIEFAKSNGETPPGPARGAGVVEIADFTIDRRPLNAPIENPMPIPQNPELAPLLREEYTPADLRAVRDFLDRNETLTIPRLSTGLFSAALTTAYSKGTNYHAVWIRDNVHVAYAHLAHGLPGVAAATARALCQFLRTQIPRFDRLIAEPALKDDVSHRPHVRFDGDTLAELPQVWSHAQNDALGYFVWLYATVALADALPANEWDVETLARLPRYFGAIKYWADEDSGHWEEVRKVSASSIGTVVAGLRKLRELVRRVSAPGGAGPAPALTGPNWDRLREQIPETELDVLIRRGEETLSGILPAECTQPHAKKRRPYDAALLFLIYPLGVLDEPTAERIVAQVEAHLRGPIGIKRYVGDSFYCSDYEALMRTRDDDPTRDFSDDIASRDALLRAGAEAEWCLFDPILSVIYGRRYQRDGRPDDLRKQTDYLNRSLAQITRADLPRCDAFRCAELYYTEGGKVQTSKSVPLLWTQANLLTALEAMRVSLGS